MAFTAADLSAVEAAIAKGEAQVQFADRSVTYRSIADLKAARDLIRNELASRPKQTLVVSGKGW